MSPQCCCSAEFGIWLLCCFIQCCSTQVQDLDSSHYFHDSRLDSDSTSSDLLWLCCQKVFLCIIQHTSLEQSMLDSCSIYLALHMYNARIMKCSLKMVGRQRLALSRDSCLEDKGLEIGHTWTLGICDSTRTRGLETCLHHWFIQNPVG